MPEMQQAISETLVNMMYQTHQSSHAGRGSEHQSHCAAVFILDIIHTVPETCYAELCTFHCEPAVLLYLTHASHAKVQGCMS